MGLKSVIEMRVGQHCVGQYSHSINGNDDNAKIEIRVPKELLGQVDIVLVGVGVGGMAGKDLKFPLGGIAIKVN